MAWQKHVLVVANQTAGSDELIDAMRKRAAGGSTVFTLLMPAGGPGKKRSESRPRLEEALERMWDADLDVKGKLGVDANPLFCVDEFWDPTLYDEIIVSTFPTGVSHWLKVDLPQRIGRLTDAPVEHVVARAEQKALA